MAFFMFNGFWWCIIMHELVGLMVAKALGLVDMVYTYKYFFLDFEHKDKEQKMSNLCRLRGRLECLLALVEVLINEVDENG
jgi:hypothetical protein